MPKRVFKYDKSIGGVIEITRDEDRALCDEIHEDAASRSVPIEGGRPGSGRGRNIAGCWPMTSVSMGVHPSQVREAQETLQKKGVYTDYDGNGNPILRDRAHKKAHQAALGYYDGDAGYADQSPVNFIASDFPKPAWR